MEKKSFIFLGLLSFTFLIAQKKQVDKKRPVKKVRTTFNPKDYEKINDSLPILLLKRENGKLGFVNQKGKVIVPFQYDFGNFFAEDCNLLHSPNLIVRKYGSADYASVTQGQHDFRIDKTGKRVYQFKKEDFGACTPVLQEPKYYAYTYRGFWGLVDDKNFASPENAPSFTIYPQYQYLYVLAGNNPENPMIIASKNNKLGIINIHNQIIIPFEYEDIKRNFSWKLGHMFEVSRDGINYYFVDQKNTTY